MKNYNIKIFILIMFSVGLLSSCVWDNSQLGNVAVIPSETDLASDGQKSKLRSKSSKSTSGRCEDHKSCIDNCEDVYETSDNDDDEDDKVDACTELSYRIAIQFEDILEVLEEPTDRGLRNIEQRAFDKFVDISIDPWVETMRDLNNDAEAERVLSWVARDSSIAGSLIKAYNNYEDVDEYEGLIELFEQVGTGSGCTELCNGMKVGIAGNRSFYDIAISTSNGGAQDIMLEILEGEDACTVPGTGGFTAKFEGACPP